MRVVKSKIEHFCEAMAYTCMVIFVAWVTVKLLDVGFLVGAIVFGAMTLELAVGACLALRETLSSSRPSSKLSE
jgi:hypothetical protein